MSSGRRARDDPSSPSSSSTTDAHRATNPRGRTIRCAPFRCSFPRPRPRPMAATWTAAFLPGHAPPSLILSSRSPGVPPQTMFGPETRRFRGGAPSQNRFETAHPFKANTVFIPGTRTTRFKNRRQSLSLGRAGYVVVPDRPTGTAARSAQLRYRALHGKRDEIRSPGYEAGRRRAIGVVAASSINPRATTPMVRRWVAGTPKRHGAPEGRGRGMGPGQ